MIITYPALKTFKAKLKNKKRKKKEYGQTHRKSGRCMIELLGSKRREKHWRQDTFAWFPSGWLHTIWWDQQSRIGQGKLRMRQPSRSHRQGPRNGSANLRFAAVRALSIAANTQQAKLSTTSPFPRDLKLIRVSTWLIIQVPEIMKMLFIQIQFQSMTFELVSDSNFKIWKPSSWILNPYEDYK